MCVIGQRETYLAKYIIASSKALDPATQSWTHTKITPCKSKFHTHYRHIFFTKDKKCYVPDFSIYVASCRVENRAKKAQNGTVSASQLVKASQNAIFFSTQQISIVLLYCVQSLVGRPLFGHKKSSEKSMYSVPCFGGHIAISRDVTRYPILVIRRTEQ